MVDTLQLIPHRISKLAFLLVLDPKPHLLRLALINQPFKPFLLLLPFPILMLLKTIKLLLDVLNRG